MSREVKGFAVTEEIGVGVFNPQGVAKASVVIRTCPVCGEETPNLMRHAEDVGDPEHRVLEVMES